MGDNLYHNKLSPFYIYNIFIYYPLCYDDRYKQQGGYYVN